MADVTGWIVVGPDGPCYESFARTRSEAIEQYVASAKLWAWDMRADGERPVKATLKLRASSTSKS